MAPERAARGAWLYLGQPLDDGLRFLRCNTLRYRTLRSSVRGVYRVGPVRRRSALTRTAKTPTAAIASPYHVSA